MSNTPITSEPAPPCPEAQAASAGYSLRTVQDASAFYGAPHRSGRFPDSLFDTSAFARAILVDRVAASFRALTA